MFSNRARSVLASSARWEQAPHLQVPKLWSDGVIHSVRPRARRSREAWRGWAIWRDPRSYVTYALAVDLLAIVWAVYAVATTRWELGKHRGGGAAHRDGDAVRGGRAAGSAPQASSQWRPQARHDLRVGGRERLSPASWTRGRPLVRPGRLHLVPQQRPAGEPLSRKVFNASVILVGALTASRSVEITRDALHGVPLALAVSSFSSPSSSMQRSTERWSPARCCWSKCGA